MNNIIKYLQSIPEGLKDFAIFFLFVLAGSGHKMFKQKEAGVKMTLSKMIAETLSSFLIAAIAWTVFDQFFDFNQFFTYAMCGLCGSMSHQLTKGLEGLVGTGFEKGNDLIKKIKLPW